MRGGRAGPACPAEPDGLGEPDGLCEPDGLSEPIWGRVRGVMGVGNGLRARWGCPVKKRAAVANDGHSWTIAIRSYTRGERVARCPTFRAYGDSGAGGWRY